MKFFFKNLLLGLISVVCSMEAFPLDFNYDYNLEIDGINYYCHKTVTATQTNTKTKFTPVVASALEGLVNGTVVGEVTIPASYGTQAEKRAVEEISSFNVPTLVSIEIPLSIKKIESDAFVGASSLRRLYLKYKSDNLSDYTFLNGVNPDVTVYVPEYKIKKITEYFKGKVLPYETRLLRDIVIENFKISFKIDNDVLGDLGGRFDRVEYGKEIVQPREDGTFTIENLTPGQKVDLKVYYFKGESEISTYDSMTLTAAENLVSINAVRATETSLSVTALLNMDESCPEIDEYGFSISNSTWLPDPVEYAVTDGPVKVTDLRAGTGYDLVWYVKSEGKKIESIKKYTYRTHTISSSVYASNITATSADINFDINPGDAQVLSINLFVTDYNEEGVGNEMRQTIRCDRLLPDTEYRPELTITYGSVGGQKVYSAAYTGLFNTPGMNAAVDISEIGPTSFCVDGKFTNHRDIEVSEEMITVESANGEKIIIQGGDAETSGLVPGTPYTISYSFTVSTSAGKTKGYAVRKAATTSGLVIELQQPKCVSESEAVVAAATNIHECETGAGFQWRKNDAPESLPSSEAYAIVCDNMLEGIIKNLQSTSYYNLRAFYRDKNGKYYYSSWTTFDPSDFSYFEPTVRTYEATSVSHSTANVKGYVLKGSDAIIRQGFEYWRTADSNRAAAKRYAGVESPSVVYASGQLINATLEDLLPDTEYTFRTFAETEKGTVYGDEVSFTTEPLAGLSAVDDNKPCPEIIGYYNQTGLFSPEPMRGLNIVVYSDRTTRKIIYK